MSQDVCDLFLYAVTPPNFPVFHFSTVCVYIIPGAKPSSAGDSLSPLEKLCFQVCVLDLHCFFALESPHSADLEHQFIVENTIGPIRRFLNCSVS